MWWPKRPNVTYRGMSTSCCSATRGFSCVHTGAIQQAQGPSNEHELLLASADKSFPPGFHQHFSSYWWENSGHGQKLYILYKHSSERQHTDSFFSVCENGGGPLSAPLCWCLSTVSLEAEPIVAASVSYWHRASLSLFPGSNLRTHE